MDMRKHVGLPLGYEPIWVLRIVQKDHLIDVVARWQTNRLVVILHGACEEGIIAAHIRVQLVIVCPLEEVLDRLHQHPLVSEYTTGSV